MGTAHGCFCCSLSCWCRQRVLRFLYCRAFLESFGDNKIMNKMKDDDSDNIYVWGPRGETLEVWLASLTPEEKAKYANNMFLALEQMYVRKEIIEDKLYQTEWKAIE
jgi:hypothetical protein